MNGQKKIIRNTKPIVDKKREERKLITVFVDHLKNCGYTGIKSFEWPEDKTRNSPEVDAIAGELVIEHTSIDALFNQRKYEDYFSWLIGNLESITVPFRLNVTISHEDIVKKCGSRKKCGEVNKALSAWLNSPEILRLPEGVLTIAVEGVPFSIKINKQSSRQNGVYFNRQVASDAEFFIAFKKQMDRKIYKFGKYRNACKRKRTILLIENNDLALTNVGNIFGEISKAYQKGLPNEVDEIWCADTSTRDDPFFEKFTIAPAKYS